MKQDAQSRLPVAALVDATAAAALFEGAPRGFDEVMREARKRPPSGFPLRARATFSRSSQHSDSTSANVVGLLPGSDSTLANEVIVFTSHLDHVGIGTARNGDVIYNGALDNGVGIATMIEVARERLVGVINLDGAMPFFDLVDVIGYGAASYPFVRQGVPGTFLIAGDARTPDGKGCGRNITALGRAAPASTQ